MVGLKHKMALPQRIHLNQTESDPNLRSHLLPPTHTHTKVGHPAVLDRSPNEPASHATVTPRDTQLRYCMVQSICTYPLPSTCRPFTHCTLHLQTPPTYVSTCPPPTHYPGVPLASATREARTVPRKVGFLLIMVGL